jgi:hypothetical protein
LCSLVSPVVKILIESVKGGCNAARLGMGQWDSVRAIKVPAKLACKINGLREDRHEAPHCPYGYLYDIVRKNKKSR